MKPQTVILYGRSGAGKGTQGKLLKAYLEKTDPKRKTLYLETGKGLRDFAKTSSRTAVKVKKILDNGGLMPEFLPIWVWSNFLIKNFGEDEHLILDGVARRAVEAPVIDSALSFYGRKHPTVIRLAVTRKVAVLRLLARGRSDDTEEDIERRLDWFESNVIRSIKYFQNQKNCRFVEIDGSKTEAEVHADILKALKLS